MKKIKGSVIMKMRICLLLHFMQRGYHIILSRMFISGPFYQLSAVRIPSISKNLCNIHDIYSGRIVSNGSASTKLSIRSQFTIISYFKQTCCIEFPSKQPNTTGGSSEVISFPSSCSSKTTWLGKPEKTKKE